MCDVVRSLIDDIKAYAVFWACRRDCRRYPVVSPLVISLMFGSGSRSGVCVKMDVLHHWFQTSSPLMCERIRGGGGGLMENLK